MATNLLRFSVRLTYYSVEERSMSPKRKPVDECPSVEWFRERTASFKGLWEETPWHENGERSLRPIKESLRRYAPSINELPSGFIPSALDQHLAVLSEGYEYQILEVVEGLGDDRYLCLNEEGERFFLWSRSAALNVERGGATLMTAIIRLGAYSAGPVPVITYGPVCSWRSLSVSDFSSIGRELGRDLWLLKGIPAVVRRDPVPFWAVWSLANVPRVLHGTQEICTCWYEGRFSVSPEPLLAGAWKRDVIGNRIRYRKPGSKPFFEQVVIYDLKSSRGILLARRYSYIEKLRESISVAFAPDSDEPCVASMTLEAVFSDVLKRTLPFADWTRPFDRLDARKSDEDRARHPEGDAELDALNGALSELIPYINARREPDWKAFAAEHGFDDGMLDTLKRFYKKYGRGP